MIPLLPEKALLVADAGFVGYDLLKALLDAGRDFLIRVGANVRLLRKLGHAKEHGGTVYLWPDEKREKDEPPLVPPLVRRVKGRGARRRCVYLLTSVTNRRVMSDSEAGRIYKLRRAVEVMYRSLKQAMRLRKVLSASPERAGLELDWAVMSMWVPGLLCAGSSCAHPPAPAPGARAGAAGRTAGHQPPRRPLPRRGRRLPPDALPRHQARRGSRTHRRGEEGRATAATRRRQAAGQARARKARKKEVEAAKRLWKEKAAAVMHRVAWHAPSGSGAEFLPARSRQVPGPSLAGPLR